jgi:hypothetical protein
LKKETGQAANPIANCEKQSRPRVPKKSEKNLDDKAGL